jgi:hypothetical protein
MNQMHQLFDMQESQDQHLQQLLSHHQQITLSMSLPEVQVPTCAGDRLNIVIFCDLYNAKLFYAQQEKFKS